MSIWKIVSGILSIVLCMFVLFQSCAAGLLNVMTSNGEVSGSAGVIVAVLLLVGGIVSIATRDAISNGGNIALIILFGIAAFIGYMLAGSYTDLTIWATWCLLCAVIAAMAIAADNVCSAWVFILIAFIGIVIGLGGIFINLGNSESDKDSTSKSNETSELDPQLIEKGLFDVTLNVPAEYIDEGITQEQLDRTVKEEKELKSATLNNDGSVTYVMSKSQHKKMMEEIKENLDNSLSEMVGNEEYPNFVAIEPNKDYTKFVVTIKSEEVGIVESFSVLAFYIYGGTYNAFNGTPAENICVQFVNEATGEVMQEANSKDMEDSTDSFDDESIGDISGNSATNTSGNLGNYYVEIKGAAFDVDYEGNSAIVITYSWTNNSEKTTSASSALSSRAFQDGVQIDHATLSSSNENFDADAEWRDIRPGTSYEVTCAFKTDNKTSPIEVEIYESFSLSDSVVSMVLDPSTL